MEVLADKILVRVTSHQESQTDPSKHRKQLNNQNQKLQQTEHPLQVVRHLEERV
jgi:hypothetical protein